MGTHSLYSGWWRLFSKGNCSFLKSGGVEKTGRQTETERGHALHPCHSLHSLYHLCDSWWIMDETIDRWAQLCSTDPLRTHISNLITTSWEISSYFSLTNNQNHFSHSHVCQPARILGIFFFFFLTLCIPPVRPTFPLENYLQTMETLETCFCSGK